MHMQVFDPNQDYEIVQRRLPHWSQAGTICFITWRTWDSIPEEVLGEWIEQRNQWLLARGIDPKCSDWKGQLEYLGSTIAADFRRQLSDRWNEQLDDCHGSCVLRRPALSKIVADSLHHFDGDRYELTDFVVMPNHVHVLVAFPDEGSMLRQCESWKHYTATQINRILRRSGRFWQQDGFDHLVRSTEQFEYLKFYIAENPRRCGLMTNEYVHFSKVPPQTK